MIPDPRLLIPNQSRNYADDRALVEKVREVRERSVNYTETWVLTMNGSSGDLLRDELGIVDWEERDHGTVCGPS